MARDNGEEQRASTTRKKKSKGTRKQISRGGGGSTGGSRPSRNKKGLQIPSQVVCTARDISISKDGIELGVLLSIAVLSLYFYGFWNSIQSLPDVPLGRLVGQNLNVAKLETEQHLQQIHHDSSKLQNNSNNENGSGGIIIGGTSNNHNGHWNNVPYATWPATIRDELNDFETLVHPGDQETRMPVPKFWSKPLHNKQFYTREQAMKVGTCIEPDSVTGARVRGDDCPLSKRTIYIVSSQHFHHTNEEENLLRKSSFDFPELHETNVISGYCLISGLSVSIHSRICI